MIRIAATLLCLALPAALAGCTQQTLDDRPVNAVRKGDLDVRIELPRRHYLVGETMDVTVTAHNHGDQPVFVPAGSGAKVLVRVYCHAGTGWELAKRYPQAATMVISPWSLAPGETAGPFVLKVPVEPDWPTHEILRVTGELNGLPDVAPGVAVTVATAAESQE